MTRVPSGTGSEVRRRALLLLVLSALVARPPARGQAGERGAASSGGSVPPAGAGTIAGVPPYARDRFDPVKFMNELSASHYLYAQPNPESERTLVFFPPVPPPLESEMPLLPPAGSATPAPPELSAFVGEIFYPMLGARLASDDLPKALRARIVAYFNAKIALQGELRSQLQALKDVEEKSREKQLAALAALEAPRIGELEAAAERLRSDLRPSSVFGLPSEGPGPDARSAWRVHAVRDEPTAAADIRKEAEAVRGTAFFQDGLSLAQRRLLFEAAVELEAKANPSDPRIQAEPGLRLISFSPEPARVLVPAGLPPEIERKLEAFLASKDSLKAELRDGLQSSEGSGPDARRQAMERLAEAQAPRIAALEAMAEEIRRGLATQPNPRNPPTPPAVPPELASRIAAYRSHKVELLKTLNLLLNAPPPASDRDHGPPKEGGDDLGGKEQAWLRDGTSMAEVRSSSLRVSVAEFDRVQNDLVAALGREEADIRESLAAYARTANRPSDRKSVNDLLKDFETARQQQETWDRFRDCQTAVMMPGLSVGQRCVLFDAGIQRLGMALPAGERID